MNSAPQPVDFPFPAQPPEAVGGAENYPAQPFAQPFADPLAQPQMAEREAEPSADRDSAGAVSAPAATAPQPHHPLQQPPAQGAALQSSTLPHDAQAAQVGGGGSREGSREREAEGEALSVRFNQDFTCFACGTRGGFRVFCCDPLWETIRRDFDGRGVGMVEMLFRCNFLAFVGGGPNPCYPPNKAMIWDDSHSRCIGELTFRSEVRGVRLRRDRIVVVLEHKVYVYNFADLKLLHQVETLSNPRGLCEVSQSPNSFVMACPGKHRQQIRIELFDQRRTHFIAAHDSEPACIALSLDGQRLATASSKGTLIRVFNTADGSKLHELRRGVERADIYSLVFSPKAPFLVAASDRGTIHVFSLRHSQGQAQGQEDGVGGGEGKAGATGSGGGAVSALSSFGLMKGVLPKYFSDERSLAFYRVGVHTRMLAAFGAEANTVIVVGSTGAFYKLQFDPQTGGEMRLLEAANFLATEDEQI
ncbi:unnamed protein product [Closterium sp. NIES-64]|nr:unnamed protein product [Closterium sp. NIES-64]CAI6012280.1 unnamed protein product [Closterium sp. NIES-65]